MLTQFFKPHPALQHVVHNIMVSGFTLPSWQVTPVSPFPPLSQHALYFYVHDSVGTQFFGEKDFKPSPKSMIIGPQLKRVNIKMGHDNLVVRVGFQPGGLHRLVKFPMHEILDYVCDGSLIFGTQINEVLEKLNAAVNPLKMKTVVEDFLMQRANQDRSSFTDVMKQLMLNNGNTPITSLAGQLNLSTRQLERKCNEYLGLSPKLFARITRFSKAYRLRENFPHLNWTSIAYQCGYFDQMHLIRDFKEFAGVTPSFIESELSLSPYGLQRDISF